MDLRRQRHRPLGMDPPVRRSDGRERLLPRDDRPAPMPAPPPSHLLAGGGAGWTPLKPTTIEIPAEHKPAIVRMLRRDGHSDALTALIVADRDCYQNDRYLVDVIRERDGVIVALSIRRHDG